MTSSIPLSILTIEKGSFHLLIPAFLEGREIHLLVDTGASRTVFDLIRYKESNPESTPKNMPGEEVITSGIGTNNLNIHLIKVSDFGIGEWSVKSYKTILMDLSHVNDTFEKLGFPPIDGILGGDLLLKLDSLIDYKNRELQINFRKPRKTSS